MCITILLFRTSSPDGWSGNAGMDLLMNGDCCILINALTLVRQTAMTVLS